MQIERNLTMKVVPLHAFVEFRNLEELVHVEPILERSVKFVHGVEQSGFEQDQTNHETEETSDEDNEEYGSPRNHGNYEETGCICECC